MVVDRCLIDARFGDNRPNACAVIAPVGKQGDRSLHDAVARIFGRAGHSHPVENSNKCLNSVYARLRTDAIAGSCGAAPALCGGLTMIFSFRPSPPVILWSQTSVWISNDRLKHLLTVRNR